MRQLYLHAGLPKTGTTFLQQLMSANKEDLLKAGFLFPGDSWAEQALATRDAMDRNKDDPALRAQCAGKWRKLVDEMLAYDGTASVFSMEFLSYASPEDALRNAGAFIHDAGVQAVKVEGGVRSARVIEALVKAGIPVMGHIGLTPQSANQIGKFRVQGKTGGCNVGFVGSWGGTITLTGKKTSG